MELYYGFILQNNITALCHEMMSWKYITDSYYEVYFRIILQNDTTESYDRLRYGRILRSRITQTYYGRYITADTSIVQQIYHGRYIMADILQQICHGRICYDIYITVDMS